MSKSFLGFLALFLASVLSSPGAVLMGNLGTVIPTAIDLTAQGDEDWLQFGQTGTTINRFSGANLLTFVTLPDATTPGQQTGLTTSFSWSNGSPTASASGANTGISFSGFYGGLNNGFRITAPADTTNQQLVVYFGTHNGAFSINASVSDGGTFSSSTPETYSFNDRVLTLDYSSLSAGELLTVDVKATSNSSYVWNEARITGITLSAAAVPEPSSLALGAAGIITLALLRPRRREV